MVCDLSHFAATGAVCGREGRPPDTLRAAHPRQASAGRQASAAASCQDKTQASPQTQAKTSCETQGQSHATSAKLQSESHMMHAVD